MVKIVTVTQNGVNYMEYKQNCLIMIQTSKCNWQIVTIKGIILVDDIKIGLVAEAEDYMRKYISSFESWTYEIKPMKGEL
jgi:hypothetical protein